MRDPLRQIKRAVSMPPGELAAKVRAKVRQRSRDRRERQRDLTEPTYAPGAPEPTRPLARLVGAIDPAAALPHRETIAELAGRALAHEFDLLGSGWTRVENTRGLEVTEANRAEAERIAALLPSGYTPIDWHVDFKSAACYRWDARGWYRDQPQVVGKGIDVKVPWELSRMQHGPLLAWGYALAGSGVDMPAPAGRYRDEFRNEVIDFIAHNPPRFGINWNCAMDVGIRVAGWVLTHDLFREAGAGFDAAFDQVFQRSVREHADHLATHLEWDDRIRGNHYIADIAGLLIASAYLPADATTDGYLHFAARELLAETLRQFHPDGSNFEASTSYHRLSAEMVVYGLAVLQGVTPTRRAALEGDRWHPYRPGEPSPLLTAEKVPDTFLEKVSGTFSAPGPAGRAGTSADTSSHAVSFIPPTVIDRVARMGRFTADLLDRHGRDPQIGDNDNGRFFKLLPATVRDGAPADTPAPLREDTRNHRHLVDAVDGFFRTSRDRQGADLHPEQDSPAGPLPYGRGSLSIAPDPPDTHLVSALLAGVAFARPDLPPFTDHTAYPGMGLYLYRHGRLTTIVRCGEVGQLGHGGHAHDDQMSFVMYADGEPVIIDPGTGCYTADMGVRNRFRSAIQHNTLTRDDHGFLRFSHGVAGLFEARMTGRVSAEQVEARSLVCEHTSGAEVIRRTFRFLLDALEVVEHVSVPGGATCWFQLPPRCGIPDEQHAHRFNANGYAFRLDYPASPNETLDVACSTGGLHSEAYGSWQKDGGWIALMFKTSKDCAYRWSVTLSEADA